KENFRIFAFLLFGILTFSFHKVAPHSRNGDTCTVMEFYTMVTADYGTQVLTTYGTLEEADLILTPATIDKGSYKVNISRKTSDLYIIEGTDYGIKTNYCLELARYLEVILQVDNNY